MIKQALNQFDYSLCAELALLIFACVFVAVTIRTLLLDRKTIGRQANIVLSDLPEQQERGQS